MDVEDLNNSELEEESQKFVFKIADRLANPYPPDLVQLMHLSNNEEVYISPHLFESLMAGDVQIQLNPFKNDVFALGLVVLEMGLFESVQVLYDLENGVFNYGTLEKMKQMFFEKYDDSILKDLLDKMLEIKEELRLTPFRLQKVLNTILASLENEEEGNGEENEDLAEVEVDPDRLNEIVENEEEGDEGEVEIYSPEMDQEKPGYFEEAEVEGSDQESDASQEKSEDQQKESDETPSQEPSQQGSVSQTDPPVVSDEDRPVDLVEEPEPQEAEVVEEDLAETEQPEIIEKRPSKDVTQQYLQELGEEFGAGRTQEIEGNAAGQKVETVEEEDEENEEDQEDREREEASRGEENGLFASEGREKKGDQSEEDREDRESREDKESGEDRENRENREDRENRENREDSEGQVEEEVIETAAGFGERVKLAVKTEIKNARPEMEDIINPDYRAMQNIQAKKIDVQDLPYAGHFNEQIPDQQYHHHIQEDQTFKHEEDQHHDIPFAQQPETEDPERAQGENFFNKLGSQDQLLKKLLTYKQQSSEGSPSYIDKNKTPKLNEKIELKRESEDDIPFDPNLQTDHDHQIQDLNEIEGEGQEELTAESDVEEVEIPKEIPKGNGFPDDKKFGEKKTGCPKDQNYFDHIQTNFEGMYQRMQVNPHIDGRVLADPQVTVELEKMNEKNKDSHIEHLASMARTQSQIDAALISKQKGANSQTQESVVGGVAQSETAPAFERKKTHEHDVPYQPRISNAGVAHLQKMTSKEVKEHILSKAVQPAEGENQHASDEPFHHSIEVTLNQITSFANKNTKLLNIENESTLPVATDVSVVKDSDVFNRDHPVSHTFGEPGGLAAVGYREVPAMQKPENPVMGNKTNVYEVRAVNENQQELEHEEITAQAFQRKPVGVVAEARVEQRYQDEPQQIQPRRIVQTQEHVPEPPVHYQNMNEENVEFTFQKRMAPQIAAEFQRSIQESEQKVLHQVEQNIFTSNNNNEPQQPKFEEIQPVESITGYQVQDIAQKNSFRPDLHEEIHTGDVSREYPVISNATQVYNSSQSTGSYRQHQANSFNKNQNIRNVVRQEIKSRFGNNNNNINNNINIHIHNQAPLQQPRKVSIPSTQEKTRVVRAVRPVQVATQSPKPPVQIIRKSIDIVPPKPSTPSYTRQPQVIKSSTHSGNFHHPSPVPKRTYKKRATPQLTSQALKVGSYHITINPETKNKRIVISSSRSARIFGTPRVSPIVSSRATHTATAYQNGQMRSSNNIQSQRGSHHRSPNLVNKVQKISVSASTYTPASQNNGSLTPVKTSQILNYSTNEIKTVTPSSTYHITSPHVTAHSSSRNSNLKVIRRSTNVVQSSTNYPTYRPTNENLPRSSRIIHVSSNYPEQREIPRTNTSTIQGNFAQKVSGGIRRVEVGRGQYVPVNNTRVPLVNNQARRVSGIQQSQTRTATGYQAQNGTTVRQSDHRRVIASSSRAPVRAVQRVKIDKKPFVGGNVMVNGEIKRSILQPKRESSKNLLNSQHYQKIISQYNPVSMIFFSFILFS